jgi:tRNA1(Val) A37 N6-methylase TrmN6
MTDQTHDHLLGGRVVLAQPAKGHRAGTDAVLLAHAALPWAKGHVADFGAGAGAAGLMAAVLSKTIEHLTLVDLDPVLAVFANQNLISNRQKGSLITTDLIASASMREAAGLKRNAFSLIITNPPFHAKEQGRLSPDAWRARAHHMDQDGLARWLRACLHHLSAKGMLVLIHRPDALGMLLPLLAKGFGAITLRFVHPKANLNANRVLLAAQKGSHAPLSVLPPLVMHEADGQFTEEAAAMHNGTAAQRN